MYGEDVVQAIAGMRLAALCLAGYRFTYDVVEGKGAGDFMKLFAFVLQTVIATPTKNYTVLDQKQLLLDMGDVGGVSEIEAVHCHRTACRNTEGLMCWKGPQHCTLMMSKHSASQRQTEIIGSNWPSARYLTGIACVFTEHP